MRTPSAAARPPSTDRPGNQLLTGKRLLVTGVLNRQSIAWSIAAAAQREGASVVLSSPETVRRHTEKTAAQLPDTPTVVDLDVTDDASVQGAVDYCRNEFGGLDGIVHAIAYGPPASVGGSFVAASASDAAEAFAVSAHSLPALANAFRDLLRDRGGSIVGLTFESRYAWPGYNWMGVAKAALEAATRYAALELGPDGIRVNLIGAGPLRTFAARGVPGFSELGAIWEAGSPLPWNVRDPGPVADAACFLLSDLARATTGHVLHVDGGMHAVTPGSGAAADPRTI